MTVTPSVFSKFPTKTYKKGQLLIFQGEVPRFGFVLKKGIIKEYDINKQGNEQITCLLNINEAFPFPWLMGVATTATYYYETVSECELYIIDRERYQELVKDDKTFALYELTRKAHNENYQTRRLAAVLNSRADNKLVNTFQYLIERYGTKPIGGVTKVTISLTHQDLANLTGLTRETVSKEIGKLKKSGVIAGKGDHSHYSINISKLNKLLSTPLSNFKI